MISVFLADDHSIVREGLKVLLDNQPDIQVLGVAADGREAVQRVNVLRPDVAVMDIAMPGLNGLEAAAQIRAACPDTQVVILSMHATSEYIYRALRAGAMGYLLKDSASLEVADAVRAVQNGERYLSSHIADTLAEDYIRVRGSLPEESPLSRLSDREREVLQLVVEGHSSAEIAETLSLSSKTVDSYRSRMMKKLGVKDLPELVKFAIRHGVTSLE